MDPLLHAVDKGYVPHREKSRWVATQMTSGAQGAVVFVQGDLYLDRGDERVTRLPVKSPGPQGIGHTWQESP